jgi:hypothetical protein
MPKLVSSENLLLENDKSFARGDEDSWSTLEDPALLLAYSGKKQKSIKKQETTEQAKHSDNLSFSRCHIVFCLFPHCCIS